MSDEELTQAKAELIERYLSLKSRLALIESKISGWEKIFIRLSREMYQIKANGLSAEHLHYPSPGDFNRAMEDWRETFDGLEVARQQMKDIGINLS